MGEENDLREKTFAYQAEQLEQAWHGVILAIEDALIPILDWMTRRISAFLEWWELR